MKNKKFLFGIILILIVLVIAYFIFFNNPDSPNISNNKTTKNQLNQSQILKAITPTIASDCDYLKNQSAQKNSNPNYNSMCPTCAYEFMNRLDINRTNNTIIATVDTIYGGRNDVSGYFNINFTIGPNNKITPENYSLPTC